MKLNLGCGQVKLDGYLNCDISSTVNPDMVINLEKKLPFKDDSVDEIIAYHVIEHVWNIIPLINEMHRVVKKGGRIDIRVPYYSSSAAASDLTHLHPFSFTSFDYVEFEPKGKNHIGKIQSHEYGDIRFKFFKKEIVFCRTYTFFGLYFFANKFPNIYEAFFANLFPANEVHFILEVVK
ncbi:MAG: methyltransferase domain-containing protein [Candidatus Nanoarchaeia archaeon]